MLNERENRARLLGEQIRRLLELSANERQRSCQDPRLAQFSLQEIRTLEFLLQKDSTIMRDIAGHLGMALSTGTALMDRMVEKGLVERHRDQEDRRIVRVFLTKKGRESAELCVARDFELALSMLEPLSDSEQAQLLLLFDKIVKGLGKV